MPERAKVTSLNEPSREACHLPVTKRARLDEVSGEVTRTRVAAGDVVHWQGQPRT